MKCPKCNTENPEGMKFCTGCGSPLSAAGGTSPKKGGSGSLFIKALKILYMLSGAVVILLFISLSKYETDVEKKWETCGGHCMEIGVKVTSPLTWITNFEMEAFNIIPPCDLDRKSSLLPAHESMTDANLEKFAKYAVDEYKEKVWANIALFVVVTLLFFGLFSYFNKKNQSGKA